jgi:hypothetical protein
MANFLKATQRKQTYCISTHTLFQSDYSDYSDYSDHSEYSDHSNSNYFNLVTNYQLPTNDRQLTINANYDLITS